AHAVAARQIGAERRDLELDAPDVALQGAAGGEPQDGDRDEAQRTTHPYGLRSTSPPPMISNSSRRFCAQAPSSWPCASGRSSPYELVSMRPPSMPWLTRYCFAAVARRLPRARLYSSDPRSSQCPLMRMRRSGLACGVGAAGGGFGPPHAAAVTAPATMASASKDRCFISRASLQGSGVRRGGLRKSGRPSRQPRAALLQERPDAAGIQINDPQL